MGKNIYKSNPSLLQESKIISNKADVANAFNNHFSNIPNDVVNNLLSVCNKHADYYQPLNFSSMFMSPTNPSERRRIIAQTKSKLSAGLDQISSVVLKHFSQNTLEVLSHILISH